MPAQPIRVGLLADVSGEFGMVGTPLLHGTQLAVEEINASGGIHERPIELIHLDPQLDIARYREYASRLLEHHKVDLLVGGILSVQREAVRAIVNQTDVMYMYTNIYEGGVCDSSMIGIGSVPEQQFSPLVPWMVNRFGAKAYTIAIGNGFGRNCAAWTRDLLGKQGGEVIGEEFFAVGVKADFDPTIARMKQAKPDWVMVITAGESQDSFFEQAAAAALNLPMASNEKIMLTYEHKRLPKPVLDNLYVTSNWVEELETARAKVFIKQWRARYPDDIYITAMGSNSYNAVHMYKVLVEKAGSTKKADLRKVIASGEARIDTPDGQMCIDAKSQHTTQQVRLFSVDGEHAIREVEDFGMIAPYWLGDIGCDLTRSDPKRQYTLSSLPEQ